MTYKSWFDAHAIKHKKLVTKLLAQNFTQEQIIAYFDFDNMVKEENDFCLLYQTNTKCHDVKNLNCYLCACPHFRFNDAGIEQIEEKTKYSFCAIDAKDGAQATYGDALHHDCSQCTIPHSKSYIKKKFSFDWESIMNECYFTKQNH